MIRRTLSGAPVTPVDHFVVGVYATSVQARALKCSLSGQWWHTVGTHTGGLYGTNIPVRRNRTCLPIPRLFMTGLACSYAHDVHMCVRCYVCLHAVMMYAYVCVLCNFLLRLLLHTGE